MTTNSDMRSLARAKVSKALDDVTVAIYTAARDADAETVHKLRVSIRRFSQAVRVFRQYLPDEHVDRITARLRKVMKAAGEVRDRDILIDLLNKTDVPAADFDVERTAAREKLIEMAGTIQNSGIPRRWRARLLAGDGNAVG